MATKDHAQADGPDPATSAAESISAAPEPSQPVFSTAIEADDSAIKSAPSPDAPQESTATDPSNTNTTDNLDVSVPNPSHQSNTEAVPLATVSPGTEEQKVAATAPELSSDASVKEPEPEESGPSLTIVLLLITGTRYPIKIDANYLRKRDITVDNNDPFAMSVYTLKELIWRSWQEGMV